MMNPSQMNPLIKSKRTTNASMEQKQILLEFIKKHPNLVSGKFSNEFTQKDAQGLWQEVTNILNSCGANKDWKSWRKTWQDIRSRTKIKNSQYNLQRRRTGGGPCPDNPHTKYEDEVLDTIKLVAIQGHNDVSESSTEFVFTSLNESECIDCNTNFVDCDNGLLIENSTVTNFQKTDRMPLIEQNVSVISSEPASTFTASKQLKDGIKKKFCRAPRKKLVYASEAAENYRVSLEKKNDIKSRYYEKKQIWFERIAAAKEKSAAAKEISVAAMERSADAIEEIAS